MRGGASTARALLRICRSSSSSLMAARSASTISSGTACITIETTTRLDIQSHKKPNDTLLKTLTLAQNLPVKPSPLGFEKLGLSPILCAAMKRLGVIFPSEIHCAAIPEILSGKSVLLTSHFDSVGSFSLGVFSYLLPLLQSLEGDAKLPAKELKGPRAIVLFSSKELAEKFLLLVEIVSKKLKLVAKKNGNFRDVSKGLFAGTPDEVFQKIKEGAIVSDEVKYLVFDEVDDMLSGESDSDINKLLSLIKESTSYSQQGLQTILVTSSITKILCENHSSLVEQLKQGQAEVSGIMVELDQTEALNLLESPEALKEKALEVIQSLQPAS